MSSVVASARDKKPDLRGLTASFRSDLRVSRQRSDGKPIYIIHDPVSFQTHRLDLLQYTLAVALDGRTLGQVFQQLEKTGRLDKADEDYFYDLVINLYKVGVVVLPIHDGKRIFQQAKRLADLKRRNRLMSLLFLRIPLANPDQFLSQTTPSMRWLFRRWFFFVWLMIGSAALLVLVIRFHDFMRPLNGILSPANLPILWLTFVALKVWHELGHGYACTSFGGRVPEMGTILIVGNPLAYVDASAAWSFPERWKRLVVMCGGMYFESLAAIPAVFVWAYADTGTVASLAYQIILTAGVTTLLFNANPLMKFDGYFILSELLGLQNLRSRADVQVRRLLKRTFVRTIPSEPEESRCTTSILISYGVCSLIYRVTLVLSIAALIASRFPLAGIVIAVSYLGNSLVGSARKIARYLLADQETASIRCRARLLAAGVFIGIPCFVAVFPVPLDIVAWGVVGAETEHHIRVDTPGEVLGANVSPRQRIGGGETLIELRNHQVDEELRVALARLHVAHLDWKISTGRDIVEATRRQAEIFRLERQLAERRRQRQRLRIVAPGPGQVLSVLPDSSYGQFLNTGDTVALIADGQPVVRAWLNQEQLDAIAQDHKASVRFRIPGRSLKTFEGTLRSVKPASELGLGEEALTVFGGGSLIVDPQNGRPVEALFQVELEPQPGILRLGDHGCRVAVALPRCYESIGSWALRKGLRFVQQLFVT